MSIMVTGGTGFIGHRIIRKLLDRGEEVICFDLAPPRANLEPFLDRIQFYRGDIGQIPHLLEAINTYRVHKIIHMAALLPCGFKVLPALRAAAESAFVCVCIRAGQLIYSMPVKP